MKFSAHVCARLKQKLAKYQKIEKARGQCYEHIVTSVSLLTINELMVKTPPTEVLVQTCQLVDRAGVKPPPQLNDCRSSFFFLDVMINVFLLSFYCLFIILSTLFVLHMSAHRSLADHYEKIGFLTQGAWHLLRICYWTKPPNRLLAQQKEMKVSFG